MKYDRISEKGETYYAGLVGGPRGNTYVRTTRSPLRGLWWRIRYGTIWPEKWSRGRKQ